jgi:hypothetical protein
VSCLPAEVHVLSGSKPPSIDSGSNALIYRAKGLNLGGFMYRLQSLRVLQSVRFRGKVQALDFRLPTLRKVKHQQTAGGRMGRIVRTKDRTRFPLRGATKRRFSRRGQGERNPSYSRLGDIGISLASI